MLSITLDWLAFTLKGNITHEQERFMATYARALPIADVPARNGYDTATSDNNGVVSMWHTVREEMGHHVIFAGSALRNVFRDETVHQRGFLQAAVDAKCNITRLDLAKDAQNVSIDLGSIWQYIKSKRFTGATRTFSTIEDERGARTIYVGSRQSERFARIYDKRAELGLNGLEWFRYELETKGMVARALAYLLTTEKGWNAAFDGMALGMVDVPNSADFRAFFLPQTVSVSIPKLEKQTDREKWIQEQVVAAVAKHYHENPKSEAVKLLLDMLNFIDEHRGNAN